ncbi:hypothetical protein pb186bvf_020670 [Paramecium bursaria]
MDLKKKSKCKHKKLAQIFSEQVGYKFVKMIKIQTECTRKMRFMILRELFQKAQLMLNKCRCYAFDLNGNFQTGLHLSATRICYDMVDMLNGAYLDEVDIYKEHHYLVSLLLYYQASPWQFDDCKYEKKMWESTDFLRYQERYFCKKLQSMEILKFNTPYRDRDTLWNQFKGQFLS